MDDYVLKLQEDLRKRLDCLSWMHNEPALHISEHFAELRRQVDLDAERLHIEILSKKRESRKAPRGVDVNATRLEFIRILEELEKRTEVKPKPQKPASEVFAYLEPRIDSFKDSSSSLDELEDSYVQLAREITHETDRVEKRLLGEQTIIYLLSKDDDQLGSLVYFGDVFLSRGEIDRLNEHFLVPSRGFFELNKSKQTVDSLADQDLSIFERESKFFYMTYESWLNPERRSLFERFNPVNQPLGVQVDLSPQLGEMIGNAQSRLIMHQAQTAKHELQMLT